MRPRKKYTTKDVRDALDAALRLPRPTPEQLARALKMLLNAGYRPDGRRG